MKAIDKILARKPNRLTPKQGRLLISEPFLHDIFFKRSVVILLDHNTDGSFGLILNKPVEFSFDQVVKGFPAFDSPVYMGGPISSQTIFFIHTMGDLISNSNEIISGLYWGGEVSDVKELMRKNRLSSQNIKFFLGYAGWGQQQLEQELQYDSWVIAETSVSEIMQPHTAKSWITMVKNLGKEYEVWTRFPSDPKMN